MVYMDVAIIIDIDMDMNIQARFLCLYPSLPPHFYLAWKQRLKITMQKILLFNHGKSFLKNLSEGKG